jgi:hypothetical protein
MNGLGVIGMRRQVRMVPVFLVAVVALILGASASEAWAKKEVIPFGEAKIFLEFNATDNDAGVQVFLDGEDWREVKILGPDGRQILEIGVKRGLRQLGLTELYFESAEPSPEEVLALFPEGDYEFVGKTLDGKVLAGTATLSHDLPAAPDVTVSDGSGGPPDISNTVIAWTDNSGLGDPAIVSWQVIVEREGDPVRVFSVDLLATSTSVTVPQGFLEPGDCQEPGDCKTEVLAIGENGNKTISELGFTL